MNSESIPKFVGMYPLTHALIDTCSSVDDRQSIWNLRRDILGYYKKGALSHLKKNEDLLTLACNCEDATNTTEADVTLYVSTTLRTSLV